MQTTALATEPPGFLWYFVCVCFFFFNWLHFVWSILWEHFLTLKDSSNLLTLPTFPRPRCKCPCSVFLRDLLYLSSLTFFLNCSSFSLLVSRLIQFVPLSVAILSRGWDLSHMNLVEIMLTLVTAVLVSRLSFHESSQSRGFGVLRHLLKLQSVTDLQLEV